MTAGDLVTWLDARYPPTRLRLVRVREVLEGGWLIVQLESGARCRVMVDEVRRVSDGPRPHPGQLTMHDRVAS